MLLQGVDVQRLVIELPITFVECDAMVVCKAGSIDLPMKFLVPFRVEQFELERLDHLASPPILTLYTPQGYTTRRFRKYIYARASSHD